MENFDLERIKSLERKVTQLSILYSVASSISVSHDERKVLDLVIDGIMDNLTPEIGIIFLYDETINELFPYSSRGIKLSVISEERIKPGEYISGKCFERGEVFEVDIENRELLEPFLRRYSIKKVFCQPIKSQDKILGVIHISKFSSVSFTDEEKWILTIFSNRAGIAIASARLYREVENWGKSLEKKVEERTKEIQEHLEKIRTLAKITLKISSEMKISKSLPFIGMESAKIMKADKWSIFVISEREKTVKEYFYSGLSEDYLKDLINNWEKVEGAKVVLEQRPLFIEDIFEIPNPFAWEMAKKGGYRSLSIVPCNFRRTLVGVNVHYYVSKREFTEKDKEIAMTLGELIALAITNSNLLESQNKTIKQLKTLNRLGRAISKSLQTQKIYEEVVELLQKTQNYPLVFILTLDRESKRLVQVASGGWLKERIPKNYSQDVYKGIIGRTFTTRKIYVSGDVKKDPYYLQYFPEVNSEIAVPIKSKNGEVIGVIDVQSEKMNAFKREDIETIVTVAEQLSILMENIELYKSLIERVKELSTFYNLSQEIPGILDLDKVLNRIILNLKPLVPFESGGILLYNSEIDALEVKAYLGPKLEEFKGIIKVGQGLAGNAFLQKKPIIANDVRKDSRYIPGAPGILSEVAVPLIYQNEAIGVLNLESTTLNTYNENHLRILTYFASLTSLAIRNAVLFEDVKRRVDELKALNEISSVAVSTLDLRKFYQNISQKIIEIFNIDTYYLAICDYEKEKIFFPFFMDKRKPIKLQPLKLKEPSGVTGWVIKNKKPLMFLDYEREKKSLPVKPIVIVKVTQSYIGVPILLKGKVLGVISIQSYKKNAFFPWHLDLLINIANQIALSLENAKLFKDVKEALKKIRESQRKIIQTEKMRALGIVSAGIAHQFNNILSAILARAQLLSKKVDDPEIKKNLEIIEKASLGGAEIVRRLLGFSKAEEKKTPKIVDVKNPLEEAIQLTETKWKNEAQAMGKRIEIRKEFEEGLFVKGYSTELREAFVNIILNSIEAIEKEGFIRISSVSKGNRVLVEIKDNGRGIPSSEIDKVFDPFFTTKGVSGTGLGLSFAFGVIKKCKGEIKIESGVGKGTTVSIFLLKAKRVRKAKEKKLKEGKIPMNILVIEDEEHVIDLIEEILRMNGYNVSIARTGIEGISKFESERFDLVMTDIGMPGMSGWKVVERIREKDPNIKIGFITGWNIKGEEERLRKLGIDFVITKPFKIEDLLSALSPTRKRGEIFIN